jgi:hypothetical protein
MSVHIGHYSSRLIFLSCSFDHPKSSWSIVQKFGGLITSGKITNGTDVSKIAELLLESSAFYDAEMISSLINTILHYTRNSIIERITAAQVVYVMSQLKASGVSLP